MARVLDDGNASDPFPVTKGVKQGCLLASTLFLLLFSAMLMDAFRDTSPGIPSRYNVMGNCLIALNANNEQEMQLEIDGFSTACDNLGFTISTKKTEMMYQPAPGNPYQEPNNTVKGQRL